MGLSTCPGCGSTVEHEEDGVAFYSHVASCPQVNVSTAAKVAPALDELFKELQESQSTLPGFMLRGMHGEPLTVVDFAGAVVDEFFKLEEDVSMGKLLKILAMIPSIIGAVKQAEDTITGPGQGPHKLNLVLNTVNAAVAAVPEVQQDLASHDLNGTVTAIVAGAVSAINAAKGGGQS
jgi:hypothetical protein